MDETDRGELKEVLARAKGQVEEAVGDYARLQSQLRELERALECGGLPSGILEATERSILQFPGLLRPVTKGGLDPTVGRGLDPEGPPEPTPLNELRQWLVLFGQKGAEPRA